MSEVEASHRALLMRVADRLSRTSASTDHLMLTKWRMLSMCQYLVGAPAAEVETACCAALEAFIAHGTGSACDKALEAASVAVKRFAPATESILPSISNGKRIAVSQRLDALAHDGPAAIHEALGVLAAMRESMRGAAGLVSLPGFRHRFELVANALEDSSRTDRVRARAAAAVLYVNEISDVVPDTLGVIGMVDDDYALRVVSEDFGRDRNGSYLHWSEVVSSLWDDLPFLQGMQLQRGEVPIPVTWLDRLSSYVSYQHVLEAKADLLVLLQPSVACSPLHTIVSLIGLVVLDAVTSSTSKAHALRVGQVYELDGFALRFEGISGPPVPGWLRLRFRDGVCHQPAGLADRMVPVDERRLSPLRAFSARAQTVSADPVRRFFAWSAAIGPAAVSNRLLLVASRRRALELLEGVQSNGIHLLDHGLVKFVGTEPRGIEAHGSLVVVVSSLNAARTLLEEGLRIQAVLVDGYDRLLRGRHDLAFLISGQGKAPIICWSIGGYYPAAPPAWMPTHRCLEVLPEDLASVLELDDAGTDLAQASLWEAATGIIVRVHTTPTPEVEVELATSIDVYIDAVRAVETLPLYWQYHLTALARTLRTLITSTPSEWSEIRRFASVWSASVEAKWATLQAPTNASLTEVRSAGDRVVDQINAVVDIVNSRATGLAGFMSEAEPEAAERPWFFACEHPEQVKAVTSAVHLLDLHGVRAVLVRDLPVCSNCVVAGWVSGSFARRLWSHTPRATAALADERDSGRWARAAQARRHPGAMSLLGAIGGLHSHWDRSVLPTIDAEADPLADEGSNVGLDAQQRVPCAFLRLATEPLVKVLAMNARVVLEDGDDIAERAAGTLGAGDRVFLGLGLTQRSPDDEFNDAVVDAVQAANPELVATAKDWRRALRELVTAQNLSVFQLRMLLASIGIDRENQTLEGWLELHRASPIAPRGRRTELAALWPLVGEFCRHTLDDVIIACARLRALRNASGRCLLQLWKGQPVDLGVDDEFLRELVERLRRDVQVCEIEAIGLGEVPPAMLGWWITEELAAKFESTDGASGALGGKAGVGPRN